MGPELVMLADRELHEIYRAFFHVSAFCSCFSSPGSRTSYYSGTYLESDRRNIVLYMHPMEDRQWLLTLVYPEHAKLGKYTQRVLPETLYPKRNYPLIPPGVPQLFMQVP